MALPALLEQRPWNARSHLEAAAVVQAHVQCTHGKLGFGEPCLQSGTSEQLDTIVVVVGPYITTGGIFHE